MEFYMFKRFAFVLILVVFSVNGQAEGLWNKVKEGASSAADSVGNAAKSLTEKETPEQTRQKIDSMEKQTLKRLFSEVSGAKALFEKSYGYAVFDTRKFSFLITTGFGAGVAVDNASSKRTYMKMGTGGVNVGMGGEFYQVVFLFQDKSTFNEFLHNGYDAGSEAVATAGSESESLGVSFVNGVAVYKLTEVGLKLTLDLTGTKYWIDDELN